MKWIALAALIIVGIRIALAASDWLSDWADSPEHDHWFLRLWLADLLIVLALAVGVLATPAHAAGVTVPESSALYRHALQREASATFGLDAPVARFAAQLHQESGWRPDARSPYAQGLAQFTPATAEWIAEAYPALRPADPWDPLWSIRAQVTYMGHLWQGVTGAATECDRWAFALSAYNGGPGWVARDRRLASAKGADASRWWSHTELHSKRAAWAFKENRGYPRRILLLLEPAYIAAGWPGSAVCPNT